LRCTKFIEVFFFPTLGENFGHVVWESLVFGCPVLTTETTPWNNLEEFKITSSQPNTAGWNYKLSNIDCIKTKIEDLIYLDEKEYSKLRVGCSNYITHFDKEKTLNDNINLFK